MRYFRLALIGLSGLAQADTINEIADRVGGHLMNAYDLIAASSYVAGFFFLCASIFKFKQHKDNPQQQTIGNPLMYLVLAVLLMYMGNIVKPIGETMFGEGNVIGGYFS